MSEFVKVGQKKSFTDNAPTGIEVNGLKICVARAGETFYAFEDRCSHAQVMLSRGDIEGDEIVCPLHGARFALKTGEVTSLPAVKPIRTFEVKVEGDDVFVKC